MFRDSKVMTLSFMIIYMLIPLAGDLMCPWILAALTTTGGLVTGLVIGRGKSMFAPIRFRQEFWMLAVAVLSFGMAGLCESGIFGAASGGDIFVYVGVFAMLFYVMRVQDTVRMAQFDLVFYAGSGILLLYLVSYAVATDMQLVPACVLSDKAVTDAIGIVIAMIAVWGFCREKECVRRAMYCAGGVVAFLVVALNDTPGMMLLLLAGIYAFVLKIPPGEAYVRRGLFILIGTAFLACNLSLLVEYTKLFKLEELSYTLQGSVLAELLLSAFALYIVSVWDKLKEKGELNKKGLSALQKKLGRLAVLAGKLFMVFLIFCVVHLWVGLDNFMLLFFGDKWPGMQEGMIISVIVKWIVRVSSALAGLWNGNILALCYREGGVIGLLTGFMAVAWTLRRVGDGMRVQKNMRLVTVVCGEVFALLLLTPVSVELLPFYAVWIYLFICDLQPHAGRKTERQDAETAMEQGRIL